MNAYPELVFSTETLLSVYVLESYSKDVCSCVACLDVQKYLESNLTFSLQSSERCGYVYPTAPEKETMFSS